jgi:hypothetical protein
LHPTDKRGAPFRRWSILYALPIKTAHRYIQDNNQQANPEDLLGNDATGDIEHPDNISHRPNNTHGQHPTEWK